MSRLTGMEGGKARPRILCVKNPANFDQSVGRRFAQEWMHVDLAWRAVRILVGKWNEGVDAVYLNRP